MDQMLLHKFVEFMSAQVHVVIKAKKKGGRTKYYESLKFKANISKILLMQVVLLN